MNSTSGKHAAKTKGKTRRARFHEGDAVVEGRLVLDTSADGGVRLVSG